jgi:ribosomal subunit interface protein
VIDARDPDGKQETRKSDAARPQQDLHCECEEVDLYAAIDLLADKLDRQVLKYKDKLYDKRV